MPRIAVVTDSAANIPPSLRTGRPLSVVPVHLILEDRSLLDEVDLSAEAFYRWLAEHPNASTSTACPSPGEFLETYSRVSKEADEIVSIHLAASLSSTYSSAVQAAELMRNTDSEAPRVQVIDSQAVSMGCGFCVLAAALAAEEGKSIDQVVDAALHVAERVKMFALLGTLRYVVRSGRVPPIVQTFAGRAPLVPLLEIGKGKVRVASVTLSRTQAIQRLWERVARAAAERPIKLAVLHAGAFEDADALGRVLADRCDCRQLVIAEFTPVMGSHTGPGLLGAAFYDLEDCGAEDRG
jgi:DegV family protein with EDD domain